jgi:hypothetical protein
MKALVPFGGRLALAPLRTSVPVFLLPQKYLWQLVTIAATNMWFGYILFGFVAESFDSDTLLEKGEWSLE